jgi:hypothetical protein
VEVVEVEEVVEVVEVVEEERAVVVAAVEESGEGSGERPEGEASSVQRLDDALRLELALGRGRVLEGEVGTQLGAVRHPLLPRRGAWPRTVGKSSSFGKPEASSLGHGKPPSCSGGAPSSVGAAGALSWSREADGALSSDRADGISSQLAYSPSTGLPSAAASAAHPCSRPAPRPWARSRVRTGSARCRSGRSRLRVGKVDHPQIS